jgi:hypothetical protein
MEVPTQIMVQFAIVAAVVLITAAYVGFISSYTSYLREKELEVTAFKIVQHITEVVNEATRLRDDVSKKFFTGTISRGEVFKEKDTNIMVLRVSGGDKTVVVQLPRLVNLISDEGKVEVVYLESAFDTYNITVTAKYKKDVENSKVEIQVVIK